MVNSDLISRIEYSEKYNDENYEYRHVIMPKELAKTLPRSTLMSEQEWRNAGIQMSRGWQHFMIHRPSATSSSSDGRWARTRSRARSTPNWKGRRRTST